MYTLTGPTDKMQPETKVQLRPEDRPAPREEPSSESQGKVKVAPIRIRFLGERPSDVNSRIQQEIADGLWDADDDDAMDVGFVMIRYNQMENENERSLLGADFDKSDLTDPERRQLQKIAELRAKRPMDPMEAGRRRWGSWRSRSIRWSRVCTTGFSSFFFFFLRVAWRDGDSSRRGAAACASGFSTRRTATTIAPIASGFHVSTF